MSFFKKLFGQGTQKSAQPSTRESSHSGSPADLGSREWRQFFECAHLHTRTHSLGAVVGAWPQDVSPERFAHSNWDETVRNVRDFLAMPYPVGSIRKVAPDARPSYEVAPDGRIGRESRDFIDFPIGFVMPKHQRADDVPGVLVWRLIEYYSRWPLARLIFLLPLFDRVSKQAANGGPTVLVNEQVKVQIFTGVELTLFAAYEGLPDGGRLSDDGIKDELLKLV